MNGSALVVVAALVAIQLAQAGEKLHLIVALDLSKTEDAIGFNGKSEFDQNLQAVSVLLSAIPSAAKFTVIAVTDRTYANPYIILAGHTSADTGYFNNRLAAARRNLISEWKNRTQTLKPSTPHSDILGAFRLAADAFSRSDVPRKVLLILSDMRSDSSDLDLERPDRIDVKRNLDSMEKQKLFAQLSGVDVFAFEVGDHSSKKGSAYGIELADFWNSYVHRSGGSLRVFSTTRDMQGLAEAVSIGASPRR